MDRFHSSRNKVRVRLCERPRALLHTSFYPSFPLTWLPACLQVSLSGKKVEEEEPSDEEEMVLGLDRESSDEELDGDDGEEEEEDSGGESDGDDDERAKPRKRGNDGLDEEEARMLKTWGQKKSMFYNTDYVDPDLGSDSEDERAADEEEQEAKLLRARQVAQLQDDDFQSLAPKKLIKEVCVRVHVCVCVCVHVCVSLCLTALRARVHPCESAPLADCPPGQGAE